MNPIDVTWKPDVAGAETLEQLLATSIPKADGEYGGGGRPF